MPSYIQYTNTGNVESFANTSQYESNWDDLRFPASGVSIGGLSTPPDVDADTGLLLFDSTNIETIAIAAQMPHARKVDSIIKPHVHWRKTSDAAGDVVWSLRYKWLNNNEVEPDWSSIITATDIFTVGSDQKMHIASWGEISGTGKTLSSMFIAQIGRLPTDAGDDYAADALLYEFDIHYQIDTLGSEQEFIK